MKPSKNLENKIPSDTYWKIQLVCTNVYVHSSLKPPLEYNQTRCLWQIKVSYNLFNQLGSFYRNIMQFQISSSRKLR